MVWKKQFSPFPSMPRILFFSKHWNWPVFSLSLPDIFQDQGSKYSLRVSSGSLYRVSPVKIPSKCYGRSNLLETLHARSTLNLWQQKILGRITWRSCSSHLTSFVSSVSNIIIHFPFAFCYWKIMIKFTIFVALRNILQNYSSKTCCKLNLLFLDITTMKWIHGNKAPESRSATCKHLFWNPTATAVATFIWYCTSLSWS